MKTLPILVSIPHGGLAVPSTVQPHCLLNPEQLLADSDADVGEIYAVSDRVKYHLAARSSRAIIDLDRAPGDRGPDGVVKQVTRNGEPVWRQPLDETEIALLLNRHHRAYHNRLSASAARGAILGMDCHTMAPADTPRLCLNDDAGTCPQAWTALLLRSLEEAFEEAVGHASPADGGYIIRSHAEEMPWVQLHISREPFLPPAEKRRRFLQALELWWQAVC